jgi:glycosyltransferase involved in cell wall biosynthesis
MRASPNRAGISRPLVSVLTATYNGAAFVAETIECVVAQTYASIEHVLVDDASTDQTATIIEGYARRHPDRIRFLQMTERAGPCRRRNDALAAARGSLIAWLDHDDLWLSRKIERQVKALEGDPGAGFAHTQYERFEHETGRTLFRSRSDAEGAVLKRLFVEGAIIAPSTVLIRRSALERRGLRFRDSDFAFGDDFFLWLALALDWRLVLVDEMLTRIRQHGASTSEMVAARENWLVSSVALLHEFVQTFPDAAEKLGSARQIGIARHWAWAAWYEVEHRRRLRAARYAARAAALDPAGAARFAFRSVKRPRRALHRLAGAHLIRGPAPN